MLCCVGCGGNGALGRMVRRALATLRNTAKLLTRIWRVLE